MPTINDIAAKAGVSHGTVSNVLNKKGNVSAEKIQLVERIAKELGYKINVSAQQLRAGTARRVCVILPHIGLKRYTDLYCGLEQYLKKYDVTMELICTGNLECDEENAVKKALSSNAMAVVIVSCLLKDRGIFSQDTRFFFAERRPKKLPSHTMYISFDFEQAGREMAKRCIRDKKRHIALLCEDSTYSNYKRFIEGAEDTLEDAGCSYKVFTSEDSMGLNQAFRILNSTEDFDGVIAMSEEDATYLKEAYLYNEGRELPAIYSLESKGLGCIAESNKYELNYKLLGQTIGKYIVDIQEEDNTNTIILENDGFYNAKSYTIKKDTSLNFLTIKNLTSNAIRMLLPRFTKETGIHINMIEMSYDECYKISQTCTAGTPYDLLRIDMAWMAELGRKIFCPLNEENTEVLQVKNQILPMLSEDYSIVGNIRYAFPLDACVQMLFYRKDLFEDELVKREFFETYKRRLKIPKNFEEYNEIAAFFTKKQNPKSRTRYGTVATYGRTFLAACDFLPRLKAEGVSIFEKSGQVNILTPQVKRAMENYLETCQSSSPDIHQWWGEATEQFSEGNTAMHIVFSNYASEMVHNSQSQVVGRIAFGPVPGNCPLSGGGSIGISRFSHKYKESMIFLNWLYSKHIAEMITYLGGYICNHELRKNMDILELYPWIEDMEKAFESGRRKYSHSKNPRFDQFRFEDILGKAVRSIASGIEDMNTALEKAQAECERFFPPG